MVIERIPDANCPHCKGTGVLVFADLPHDAFECKCTRYPTNEEIVGAQRMAKELLDSTGNG